MKIVWNKKNKVLVNNNRVIISNEIGNWMKISEECYKIIDTLINEIIELDNLNEYFDVDEDSTYIRDMISKLEEARLIISKDKYKEIKQERKDKLETVSLLITNKCNLKCLHCCQDAGNNMDYNELTTRDIFNIIDAIVDIDVNIIMISGGEPLIRKDFIEIMTYLKSKFKGKLILMTNALLINEKNIDLIISSFDSISISIDGCNEELMLVYNHGH